MNFNKAINDFAKVYVQGMIECDILAIGISHKALNKLREQMFPGEKFEYVHENGLYLVVNEDGVFFGYKAYGEEEYRKGYAMVQTLTKKVLIAQGRGKDRVCDLMKRWE